MFVMQKAQAVRQGAAQLKIAENALDKTLCEVATLSHALIQMRMETNLSAVIGQECVEGIANVYKTLASARGEMIALHKSLDAVKTQIGCRTVSVGTDGEKPTDPKGQRLSVVGNAEEAA
jgi:hypothetical protein